MEILQFYKKESKLKLNEFLLKFKVKINIYFLPGQGTTNIFTIFF